MLIKNRTGLGAFFLILVMLLGALSLSSANETGNAENPMEKLFPDGLVDESQAVHDVAASLDGKLVGLYFSASWCRGCVTFSKILVPFRNRHAGQFEVILLGFDKSSSEMHEYMKNYEMTWLAVPWESPSRLAIKEYFKISDIPTLIVLAPDGRVITTDGYKQVDLMGDEALQHWLKIAAE